MIKDYQTIYFIERVREGFIFTLSRYGMWNFFSHELKDEANTIVGKVEKLLNKIINQLWCHGSEGREDIY